MSEEKLYQLLRAYFSNTIVPEDCTELLQYLEEADEERTSLAIDMVLSEFKSGVVFTHQQSKTIYTNIISDQRFKKESLHTIFKINYDWLKYAAVFLIFFATAIYLAGSYYTDTIKNSAELVVLPLSVADSTRVMLSTSNGTAVALDTIENGLVAVEGDTKVNKTAEGMLAYQHTDSWIAKEVVFHTLSVPRGKTYGVQLPDGTNVWLNSTSSLSYPSEFLGKVRKVVLTGEAYFEVARNEKKPFLVEAHGSSVEVLGTHFNISAYKDDEIIKTTLLEGSVKVSNKNKTALLAPGQQSIINTNQSFIQIQQANIETVMAWKNGYFVFNDNDIKSIMKDLVRWYNVDVEYRGEITNQKFGGTFSKTKSVTELLKYLETLGNVNFKIEGRKVIVMD